jgi:hypothetical protein
LALLSNINMRFYLILVLLIGMAIPKSFAQAPHAAKQKPHLVLDSSKVELRHFNEDKLKAYRQDPAFLYDDVVPKDESLWARFWRWVWDVIRDIFGSSHAPDIKSPPSQVLKYLVIAVFAGLVVFLIVKLTGIDLRIFSKKSKTVDVPYTEALDNIHEIDFSDETEKAIANGNFRLAVRLFYLQTLKKLDDQQLIRWQPEKTNQVYVAELNDSKLRDTFNQLTLQFEYVWYGEFFIDRENFNQIRSLFDQFNRRAV